MSRLFFALCLSFFAATAMALTPIMPQKSLETVEVTSQISHPVLKKDTQQTAYIKVRLDGGEPVSIDERNQANIALVLDRSGSMSGNKMKYAKKAALLAVDRLSRNDIVSVVVYDDSVDVVVPATKLTNPEAVKDKIRDISLGGNTALYDGTKTGSEEVEKFLSQNNISRVILLSDGQANVGPDTPEALGKLGSQLLEKGIAVTTIGLGTGYNEDLMVRLAQKSDGNHAFVEHPRELAGIFDKEFGDVLSVVARDVRVEIECVKHLRPVRLLGREGKINGQKVSVTLNQLYARQEKYVLLEVEVQEKLDDTHIADVNVRYRDIGANRKIKETDDITVRYSSNANTVKQAINQEVMADALQQLAVVENERAVTLRDAGKVEEAQEVIRNNADLLKLQAPSLGSYGQKLEDYAAEAEADADALADDTQWDKSRKDLRQKQYKIKNKQSY